VPYHGPVQRWVGPPFTRKWTVPIRHVPTRGPDRTGPWTVRDRGPDHPGPDRVKMKITISVLCVVLNKMKITIIIGVVKKMF
jgi:hypothetical protein